MHACKTPAAISVTTLDMQTSFATSPCQEGLRQASPTNDQVVVFWMDLVVHGDISATGV